MGYRGKAEITGLRLCQRHPFGTGCKLCQRHPSGQVISGSRFYLTTKALRHEEIPKLSKFHELSELPELPELSKLSFSHPFEVIIKIIHIKN